MRENGHQGCPFSGCLFSLDTGSKLADNSADNLNLVGGEPGQNEARVPVSNGKKTFLPSSSEAPDDGLTRIR